MAKKTPAAPENAQDSAQQQPEAAIATQGEFAPQAASTLPFAKKRDELIKKFRANAVPREADYKQLLDEHYDVAGALGLANSEDNNGATTGNGLVFDSTSGKLQVKANTTGGLVSEANGIRMVPGKTLQISANTVDVKINQKNGLKISAGGEVGVNLFSQNSDNDGYSAAVIANLATGTAGLWVHVGAGGDKKGLKQYKSTSTSDAVLGVSHDDTLKIDSTTGKLGVRPHSAGGLVTSASGLMLNTNGMSGLKIEGNALKLDIKPGFLLTTSGNTIAVDSSDKAVMDWYLLVANPEFYAHTDDYKLFFYTSYGYEINVVARRDDDYSVYKIFYNSTLDGVVIMREGEWEKITYIGTTGMVKFPTSGASLKSGSVLTKKDDYSVTFKNYP